MKEEMRITTVTMTIQTLHNQFSYLNVALLKKMSEGEQNINRYTQSWYCEDNIA